MILEAPIQRMDLSETGPGETRTRILQRWLLTVCLGGNFVLLLWHWFRYYSSASAPSGDFFLWDLLPQAGLALLIAALVIVLFRLFNRQMASIRGELVAQSKKSLAKSQQISHVAFTARHDLRGGLDGLIFAMELLRERFSEEQIEAMHLDEVFELLSTDIEKQAHLLDSMKDWLETVREEEMQVEETNLDLLLGDLETETDFMGNLDVAPLPTLRVCRAKFGLVLEHLIQNGLLHNDRPTPEVYVYSENDRIVIEDNGRGFDTSKFDHLCQPFQRLAHDRPGTGMGLAITKGICDIHGFHLSAESVPGKGTRVFIDYQR